jgi:hypothetical protein
MILRLVGNAFYFDRCGFEPTNGGLIKLRDPLAALTVHHANWLYRRPGRQGPQALTIRRS